MRWNQQLFQGCVTYSQLFQARCYPLCLIERGFLCISSTCYKKNETRTTRYVTVMENFRCWSSMHGYECVVRGYRFSQVLIKTVRISKVTGRRPGNSCPIFYIVTMFTTVVLGYIQFVSVAQARTAKWSFSEGIYFCPAAVFRILLTLSLFSCTHQCVLA